MPVPLCLRVFRGDLLVGEHEFDREMIKIGRLASAHLPIDEPKASRVHAVLHADPARLSVVDMGSVEGTFLNGKRINRATVSIGDELRIGETRIVIAAPRSRGDEVPAEVAVEAGAQAEASSAAEVVAPPAHAAPPAADPTVPVEVPLPAARRALGAEEALGRVGLQVRYYWGDALLQVSQHGSPGSIFVGETGRSELLLAADRLGARELELISASDEGGFQLNVVDGMRGGLERHGERQPLGPGSWPLGRSDFAWVEVAGIRAELQFAQQPRRAARRSLESYDLRFLNLLMALLLLAGLFVVSAETRADVDVVADDLSASRLEFAKVVFTQASRPKPNPLLERMIEKPAPRPRESEQGERVRGREGQAGHESARASNGRSRPRAIVVDSATLAGRPLLLDAFRQAGSAGATVFGEGGLGGELKANLGGLAGPNVADSRGFGGLGSRGNGPGGGGIGSTIGIGPIGTRGRASGVADYGRDAEKLGPKENGTKFRIDDGGGPTTVGYDRDLIRKAIRANVAQIRFCYEDALRRLPELSGRVVVRFVIDSQGRVASAVIAEGTNIGDRALEGCIRARVLSWNFPAPKAGGEAIVTYPFLFKPSGD